MPHTILLTRPIEDSKVLAHQLEAQGFSCLIEPMLEIEHHAKRLPHLEMIFTDPIQATLITSRHAVDVLAQCKKALSVPLIAVGKSSADAATEYGFKKVICAEGNAESLLCAIKKQCVPGNGTLFYAQGEHTHADIAAILSDQGFRVKSSELYTAHAIHDFSPSLITSIKAKSIHAVLFYSARTAQIYENIATKREGLAELHRKMIAVCLSQNIAKALYLLPWEKVYVGINSLPHYFQEKESIQNR